MQSRAFNLSVGDRVYIRSPKGVYDDVVVDLLPGGIVKLKTTLVDFYLTGKPVGMGARSVYRILSKITDVQPTFNMPVDWLTKVKEKDRIVVEWANGKKILTVVERITPSGRIKVRGVAHYFYRDGSCVHKCKVQMELRPATPDIVKILTDQNDRKTALRIIKGCHFDELSVKSLTEISKIIISDSENK
jgi:hypothetical protein